MQGRSAKKQVYMVILQYTFNSHEKPDYVIEDNMVRLSPGFVSIADQSFKLHASMINMGMAINKNIVVEVKREYPDGTVTIVKRDTIPGIRYIDSVIVNVLLIH
jgi:hypothetical protein